MFNQIGNIGRKLLALSLVSTLVPLLIIGLLAGHFAFSTINDQTLTELNIIAESTKGEFIDLFKYFKARTRDFSSDGFIKESLESFYYNQSISGTTIDKLNQHLILNKLPILTDTTEVFIMDRDGIVVASTNKSQLKKNYVQKDFFQNGLNDVYISDKINFNEQNLASWIISAPITSKIQNQLLGIISLNINPKILSNITTGRATAVSHPESKFKQLGSSGETYLVSKERVMLTESRFIENSAFNQKVNTKPVELAFDFNKEMLGTYNDYRGVEIIGTSKIIKETGWLILTELDKDEAFYPIRIVLIISIIITIVFVPIFFTLTLFFVKKFTQPIINVTNAAYRITHGHWNERVPVDGKTGEMARLADDFNKMVETLLESRNKQEIRVHERTAELNAVNEDLKRFAYIVSHDLRAPLVNIKGFTCELKYALEVIESTCKSLLPHLEKKQKQDLLIALEKDIPESLGFIDTSTTRMDNLITAVLKLSRLGGRSIIFEDIDMQELVKTTIKTLAHQIAIKNVDIEADVLPKIIADRTSMEQIMTNLLDNAIKYMKPNQKGKINITCKHDVDVTTFDITDNGRGISKDDTDKIFDIFRRSGKQDVEGEGMGLAYVKTLVQNHGGNIWCESELGKGSTFSFSISNYFHKGEASSE